MSIKVGITGGIGVGKSYVAKIFKTMGIPVYDADTEAKKLMKSHPDIKENLIREFGENTYTKEGELDNKYLAKLVFDNTEKLNKLNAIVHPVVIQHGRDWGERQKTEYSLKEAALLFESGSYKELDYTILVTAPIDVRIARVMGRDGVDREAVLQRMAKQMPEDEKATLADFTVANDGVSALLPQIMEIHKKLIAL